MKQALIGFAIVMLIVPVAGSAVEGQPDTSPGSLPSALNSEMQTSSNQNQTEEDPLIEMLNIARENDDVDLVRSLEAQISRPKVTVGGEASEGIPDRVSRTYSGSGDPTKIEFPPGTPEWWFDIKVTPVHPENRERHPGIATASNGDMYVVFEDAFGGDRYIQVYWSQDGGTTWVAFQYVAATGSNLVEPTVAIGEGSTGNLLLIAYIVDDGINERYVEVATSALSSGGFTTRVVGGQPGLWDYYKPVIWTDSHSYSPWYGYMIAEAMFNNTTTNRNVTFWRSTNGTTWDTPNHVWGDFDADAWIDPDGTFGTSGRDVFITVFNDTNDTLYMRRSLDLGNTFEAQVEVRIFPADQMPSHPVDPDIEAAINGSNLMVACTKAFNGNDNPAYSQSTDNGVTWGYLNSMSGFTDDNEFGAALHANEGGESFFQTWTTQSWEIFVNTRPQDFSAGFSGTPSRVNDTEDASASYPVKGITSNWTSNMERVVWSDFREGSSQYSIFYDEDFFFIIIIPIFVDGFESGNFSAWSAAAP